MRSTEPIRSGESGRPALARHVRLSFDHARERHVLLGPESVSVLNRTGADILTLCDGRRTVAEIAAELRRRYDGAAEDVIEDEVRRFIDRVVAKRWVEITDG